MWSDTDSEGIELSHLEDQLLPGEQQGREEDHVPIKIVLFLAGFFAVVSVIIIGLIYWGSGRADLPSEIIKTLPLVVLSIDGFRYSYLEQHASSAPHILSVASGISVPLRPVFPSKTFPNHFTMATGLYPETHGIVSNAFYDPVYNETFKVSNPLQQTQSKWWNGEPIWITARKNNLNSAVNFWPGSEARYEGIMPTYWSTFNQSVTSSDRVKTVLAWLSLPEAIRPMFTALYFDVVDSAGHAEGPDSEAVVNSIRVVDNAVGQLLEGFKTLGIDDKINFLIVSDHGMTAISPDRFIRLQDYVDLELIDIVDQTPVCYIIPRDTAMTDHIMSKLQNIPHAKAYLKEKIPARYRYANNRRITPIIVVADEGWSFTKNEVTWSGGAHGYDNEAFNMTAILLGKGPQLEKSLTGALLENIHLYSLMCSLLNLTPADNNGSTVAIQYLLSGGFV